MKLLAIGITSLDDKPACLLSQYSDMANMAVQSISMMERSVLLNLESTSNYIYTKKHNNVIFYTVVYDYHLYTLCTDREVYPYTPYQLNFLHHIFQAIIHHHKTNQMDDINNLIITGEILPACFRLNNDYTPVRIKEISRNRLDAEQAHLKDIERTTWELSTSPTSFSAMRKKIEPKPSFFSSIRWFFGLFTICGSCMSEDDNLEPKKPRKIHR